MTGKHTPGPWTLKMLTKEESMMGEDGEWSVDASNGDGLFGNQPYYPYVSNNIADARLIAAAPDLLGALKVAQLWLDIDGRFDMQGINAAIAKAEGR